MSEVLVGSAEKTGEALGMSPTFIGLVILAVILGIMVVGEGRSNWFKGVQLLAMYAILAAVCYLVPSAAAP